MAQSESPSDEEQTTTTTPAAVARVQEAAEELAAAAEELDDMDAVGSTDGELIDAVAALKDAESEAEDARKNVAEEVLSDRVEAGESAESENVTVSHVEATGRNAADAGGIIRTLHEEGVDIEEIVSVKTSKATDAAESVGVDISEYFSEYTYNYFRVTENKL
jgi:hypothetical protein